MTQQSGHYGYEQQKGAGGIADQVIDQTRDTAETARRYGGEALDRADEWLRPVGLSIKEQPVTCLALVAGLAFAAGALWKIGQARRQTETSDLFGRLSDLPSRMKTWNERNM